MAHLSLTDRQWIVAEPVGTGPIVEMLLKKREIEPLGEGEILDEFGHDARHFRDFAVASARIQQAVERRERIAVFGDYDCDGITGSALLVRFLRRRGIEPLTRLPHRLKEGYGLKASSIDEFHAAGVTLLLTVDTGVTALEPITRAKSSGMDVIVLDHHALPPVLPPALAILHPALTSRPMDGAPCGAGVAWSLVRALEEDSGEPQWHDWETDIALAAIGTVADIVELRGGNRTLTHSGLLALRQLREGPLALLCMHAGLQAPYSSRDIGFRIAPRINAAGRMADPHIALHALLGDSSALLSLDALNRERQDAVADHLEDLLPRAAEETTALLCFSSEDYSPGICGLLAGRITEAFGKPSLVAARAGSDCVASLRSVPGYDVTAGLARCSELLGSFGGHAMAAGCAFDAGHFDALRERLQEDIALHLGPTLLTPVLHADAILEVSSLTIPFCDALSTLEPFGAGNPEPRFLLEGAMMENVRCVGRDGTHLQATVRGRKLIGFNMGHLEHHAAQPLDLLCRIGIDAWQGRKTPQLFLDDIRLPVKISARAAVKR